MNGIKTMWIAVAVVAAGALLVVGYSWGASRGGAPIIGSGDYAGGYAKGIADAKKKLEDSHLIPPSPETVTSIAGSVKSIGDDRFVMNANQVSINPLDAQSPVERTVIVSSKTEIVTRIPMSPEESAQAMKTFQENMKAGKAGVPPSPYSEKVSALSDLKIGMIVTVTAAEDIKNATTINATKITFDAIPSSNPMVPGAPQAPTAR